MYFQYSILLNYTRFVAGRDRVPSLLHSGQLLGSDPRVHAGLHGQRDLQADASLSREESQRRLHTGRHNQSVP